jgi:hypothetical protein
MNRNGEPATDEQMELLATAEGLDLDDLLDESLTQGEVVRRLRTAMGVDRIPNEVLRRREQWRKQRQTLPACRMCGKEGDSTKHHFINKWILKELSGYAKDWADRSKNTIPLCIHCHRDIHSRNGVAVSIADYLNETEKAFAEAALGRLAEERPKLMILLARGSDSVYESRLIKDWMEGMFRPTEDQPEPVFPADILEQVSPA